MTKMEQIVEECLATYVGGDRYFHAMDDYIKFDPDILKELLNRVPNHNTLILSGEFGNQMTKYIHEHGYKHGYVYLTGSPRKYGAVRVSEIRITQNNIHGVGIFIDDTIFSGRTYYYCKGYVEASLNIHVSKAIIAYDGSKHKLNNVESLYRYYDYHTLTGKKKIKKEKGEVK